MPDASGGEPPGQKLSSAEKKRLRKQKAKVQKQELKQAVKQAHEALHKAQESAAAEQAQRGATQKQDGNQRRQDATTVGGVIVEYVPEPLEALEALKQATDAAAVEEDPYDGITGLTVTSTEGTSGKSAQVEELERIAQHFVPKVEEVEDEAEDAADENDAKQGANAVKADGDEDGGADDPDSKTNRQLKREKAELTSQMITQLKQDCPRPEVVEVWDIRARDPKLLVFLKSYRNTVPVPRHWSQKRKYLQGKRGIEKPPFELPSFIQSTGIADMRNALEQRVEEKLKNKGKQRMRPKMGKMEIDYGVLHDAFFKYQDKPKMTRLGDLYYEGKEYEMDASKAFPGVLSPELRDALGMTEPITPPPWLINMQRYGPPPSYPSLNIPGLNAPIPPGAEFGYHPGGWGKPPVDQAGQPLYGDVFGQHQAVEDDLPLEVKTHRWAELEEEEEESSEEESEAEEAGEGAADGAAAVAAAAALTQEQLEQGIASGMMTGLASSLEAGIETDATLDLRKGGGTSTAGATPALYTVLEQQAAEQLEGLAAVGHTYKMPAGQRPANAATRKRLEALQPGQPAEVDVAVDPEELERLGEKGLATLYASAAGGPAKDDYSDMIASNAAARKRKLQEQAASKAAKKAKDSYKF